MKRQTFMKSTLCLLMALVCNVAWAAIEVSTSVGTPEHVYRIKSRNNFWMTSCTSLGDEDNSGVFAFFNADGDGAYKVYSVERQKWVSYFKAKEYKNGTCAAILVDTQEEANAWKVTASGDYYLFAPYLSNGNVAGFYWNWFEGIGSNPSNNVTLTIGLYNSNSDGGSLWTLSEVAEFDFTKIVDLNGTYTDQAGQSYSCTYKGIQDKTKPVAFGGGVAAISNEAWNGNAYTANITFPFMPSNAEITNHVVISPYNNFANKYYASGTDVKSYNGMNTALPTNVKNYLWAFYSASYTDGGFKFKIKNVGTGTYLYSDPTTEGHADNDVLLKENIDEASSFIIIAGNQIINEGGKYLSVSASGAGEKIVGNYHMNHNGTKNKFVAANNYTLTLSDESTYSGTNGVHNVQGGSYTYSNGVWNESGYSANVDFTYSSLPFPISTAEATNATMIGSTFAGKTNTFKWFAADDIVKIIRDKEVTSADLASYLWAIYPSELVNGAFTYFIKHISTEKYIYTEAQYTGNNGCANNSGTEVTLSASPMQFYFDIATDAAKGEGQFYHKLNGTKNYFSWNGVGTTSGNLGVHAKNHDGTYVTFTTSFSVTTNTSGYFALYTPTAVTVPDGITVYKGKMVTANKASLIVSEVENITVIPANTAVIIKGDASTKYTFNKSNEAGTAIEGNVLMGSANSVATNSIQDGVPYTLQADGTFTKHAAESILGYNVYIKLPTGTTNPVKILGEEDFVDGVEDFVQGGVYTFVSSKGWVGATATCDNVISTAKAAHNVTGSAADAMFQWTVYKSNNGNYYLYSIGKQMFMGVQSSNNASVPFTANPAGKKLTFKNSNVAGYPIMFSTDNAAVVNHNGGHGDGCISWTGGWNNLTDVGNAHQVTLVKTLTNAELQAIADIVEAYDKRLYVRAEVEGSWADNPNTHFGSVTATTSAGTTLKTTLKTTPAVSTIDYVGTETTTIDFTRAYRGFEFQGFKLGEQELGKSFTLTDDLKSSITEQNPLVAKFTATDEVTLFYDDDEFSYRIPAIATTSTGRLIAVSDYRHSLDDIGRYNFGTATPGIDLVIRTSDDNGKTWSDTTIIAKGSGVLGADDCAYGDAAIAVVGQKVLVMGAAGDVMFGNGSATAHNRTVRIFSENNGGTWTAPQDISETFFIRADATINSAYSLFFGSGKLAVDENYNGTGNARIYGAVLVKKNGTNNGIYVVYTDDFGLTWSILGGSQTHLASNDEPKVEILPSGQILLSIRRGGGRQFNVFTYTNKATNAGSWNGNADGCSNGGSNTCNGEIFLIDAKKADGTAVKLLLQSQPKGGSGQYDRRDVTIWYKEVDNTSYTSSQIAGNWTQGMQVSTQQSAYSTMSLQEDGKIAFFFEEAPCYGDDQAKGYCMVYLPLTIEEITKNNYFSLDADFTTERNISVVLTDAQGNEYRDQFESTLPGVTDTLRSKYPFITLGDNATLEPADGENFNYTNTVTLPFKVSNNETTVWHNIYWHGNNANELVYLYGGASGDGYVAKKAPGSGIPYGASDYNTANCADNMSWAIYHAGNFTFTFKNKLTNKFIQVTSVATNTNNGGKVQNAKFVAEDATAFEIVKEAANQTYKGDYSLKATVEGVVGYLCNTSASYGWATHYTSNDHEGGWATIVEAPDFEALFASINSAIASVEENYVNAGLFGTHLGQYHLADDLTLETIRTAMENPNKVKFNVLLDYKEKLNAPQLNTPKAGQFFRIKAVDEWNDDAPYLGAQNSTASTSRTEFVANADESTVFYYDGSQLVSYKSGYYLCNNSSFLGYAGVQTSGTTFGFYEASNGLKGAYNISFNNGGRWLYCNTANYTDAGGRGTANGYCFNLEEVTELPFTISSVGYGTLWAPVALEIPDHVKAYTGVLNADENVLELTKITTDIIPANTGVVIYRDDEEYIGDVLTGTTHNFAITSTTETLVSDFSGSVAKINAGANAYTLQSDDSSPIGVAFKPSAATIPGFKAYFELPSQLQAQALRIRFAGTTEIEKSEIRNEKSEMIFDLQGRPVENPTKGIYIVNGKKVVIK